MFKSHMREVRGLYHNSSLMCILKKLLAVQLLLIMNIVLCVATCSNAEYEINEECCPMCDPGKRVHKHCDEYTSTTCDSCLVMTYTNTPSGLTECLPCSFCDPSNGLRVKQACTLLSNTVCEPLPGYYCIDFLSNCIKAIKHSACSPGQYINQTEYEIHKQCCPKCAPGNHVHWHCTDDTSTTCAPCPSLTFIDEPNGLKECFPCSICDAGCGLRVTKVCTRSSDTVCGPLERFYCIEKKKASCTLAMKHLECSTGQYIKQAGTASTDTICANCTGDTYSNGSFSSCLPHTRCETLGLTETNPGTHSSDSKCGNPSTAVAIIAPSVIVTLILILVLFLVFVFIFKHIQKKQQSKRSVVGGRKAGETFETEEQS
ncbi:tumor necrosis factor receptor superfamily member 14-like [Puntigrus tetrazona]|uniref:tumor necrosis factor receptor superfamily member 14-like n=1 Tax=Puntigrus tetrazona TaxID=1606681 RepID=UPI001C8A2EB4|nr:tumor necrosis factor receptor superfamily member 14-like [Puntigrus tetrazona]